MWGDTGKVPSRAFSSVQPEHDGTWWYVVGGEGGTVTAAEELAQELSALYAGPTHRQRNHESFCRRAGIGRTTLSRSLHGHSVPSRDVLERMLDALDADAEVRRRLRDLRDEAAGLHGGPQRAPSAGPRLPDALTGLLRRQHEEGARFDWPWRASRLPVTAELYVPVEVLCSPTVDEPAVPQAASEMLGTMSPGRILVLTAEAGGGKSTLLRQVAASLSALHLRAPQRAKAPLPLLVPASAVDLAGRAVETALLHATGATGSGTVSGPRPVLMTRTG